MVDPTRQAYVGRERNRIRALKFRIQFLRLKTIVLRFFNRLLMISLCARLFILKTPDYLTAALLIVFRRHDA
jgi:hypothetical protein